MVEHEARGAIERSKVNPPQVFLLDIGLPEIDGNELAKRLRAQPGTADAVLIAIRGYGQEQDRAQAAAAGFNHHLVKPVDIEKLNAILADI
jgi:CheY-like chemotaxis protein